MEFWFSEFHTPDVKHSIRVNKQLYSKQSDYQRIDIFETPEFGRVLTLDGNVMLTERDEFIYDEMIVHVPMAVHREAKDILVIGAGDGGVVRELTRYDRVERIDLVEMDPQVVEACRAYLPGNACRMDDRRVHIYFENALKFIRQCEEEYDLIIVDSSDPFGPNEQRDGIEKLSQRSEGEIRLYLNRLYAFPRNGNNQCSICGRQRNNSCSGSVFTGKRYDAACSDHFTS